MRVTTLQVVRTHVPLSPSSVIWYRPKGGDALWLGRWPQAWRKLMAAYRWVYYYVAQSSKAWFFFTLDGVHYLGCDLTLVVSFFTPLRYVPNVAKRSIWDQCKKKYILTTDRPATELSILKISSGHISARGRPIHFMFGFSAQPPPPSWKIQMAISPRRIIRFTPCLVLGCGFLGRRIKWRYFRFDQIQ